MGTHMSSLRPGTGKSSLPNRPTLLLKVKTLIQRFWSQLKQNRSPILGWTPEAFNVDEQRTLQLLTHRKRVSSGLSRAVAGEGPGSAQVHMRFGSRKPGKSQVLVLVLTLLTFLRKTQPAAGRTISSLWITGADGQQTLRSQLQFHLF